MKKTIFLAAIVTLFGITAKAQSTPNDTVWQTTNPIKKVVNLNKDKEGVALFPGGEAAWAKYLDEHVNAALGKFIPMPTGVKKVTQTAHVTYNIDSDGSIIDIVVTNADTIHPKLTEEAIRVLKNSPKWNPAIQNGKPVKYKARQTITWVHGRK